MNLYLFGAGSSKAYDISKTGQKLPLSVEFFETYNKMDISSNGWVIVGDIVNYVRDYKGIAPRSEEHTSELQSH